MRGNVVEEGVSEGLGERYPVVGVVGQHLEDEVEEEAVFLALTHAVLLRSAKRKETVN